MYGCSAMPITSAGDACARLLEHLVELVDDHLREVLRVHLARDDHRDVVELLRVRHRPQRLAAARAHRQRLVVVAPVQRVAVAGLGQQVGRGAALGDPRRQPARGRLPAVAAPCVRGRQRSSARSPASSSTPWRSALLWPWPTSSSPRATQACHQLGAVVVQRGVDQRRRRQRRARRTAPGSARRRRGCRTRASCSSARRAAGWPGRCRRPGPRRRRSARC